MNKIFTLLLFLSFSPVSFSQTSQDHFSLYAWFDNQVGVENTRLLNGVEYIEAHRSINEKNKYFNPSGVTGSILYSGEWFPMLQYRYNVYDDILLVRVRSGQGTIILQLIKDKVERFQFDDRNFINIAAHQSSNSAVVGFHEVLMENASIKILKKHQKSINEKRDREVAYFEFEFTPGHYAYYDNGHYYILKNKEDLISRYPRLREFINDYYRRNNSGLNSQPDLFMINLFRELTSQLAENNKVVSQ